MSSKKLFIIVCAAFALLVAPGKASAQDSTSGAISGTVKDSSNGEVLAGVTVVITSIAKKNQYNAITDGRGYFKIASLSPGDYSILYIYGDVQNKMPSVPVNVGRTSNLYPKLDLSKLGSEIVIIRGRPNIDTTKTTQGIIIDKAFTENLPIPGRSFESALGAAAGSQNDGQGVSFSGSSSLENQYVIDGVNTTGLSYGRIGSPIINEFVDEIEIITGGYMAEHGRSTGGVINVVTRSGTNDFHGTVFTQFTNSFLQKRNERAPIQSWIDVESNLAYDLSIGATLGGPIIKDELWFFVGIAPRLIANDTDKITKRQTDCRQRLPSGELSGCEQDENGMLIYADGEPDQDDEGFFIYDELDRKTNRSQATEYQFVSKINYSPTPEHAGQVTFSGTPVNFQSIGVTGETQAVSREVQILTTDFSAKWTSKFNDAKTTIEAVVGVHRSTFESKSISDAANSVPHEHLRFGNFGNWAAGNNTLNPSQPRESQATIQGCKDSMDTSLDPYQFIDNCPDDGRIGYHVGGIGFLGDEKEQRTSGKLALIQRVELAGNHEIKVGVDFEDNFLNKKRLISGDNYFTNFQGGINRIEVFRYVALAPEGDDSGRFTDLCGRGAGGPMGDEPVACDYTPPGDVKGNTLNLAAYLQDSWQIRPNLTLNVGMRYEEQRLRNAEHLRGTTAVGTGAQLGKNAMVLNNMWAPRLGLIYDWTKEGRSKVYVNWGRYFESIPMNINDRSFGGESWMRSTYDSSDIEQCGPVDRNLGGDTATPSGAGCLASGVDPANGDRLTGAGVLVATGLKAQYLDEAIVGAEYEIMEDLKIGLSYQNRTLGRVLEDLSTDNAATYVLANPGSWSTAEENKLLKKIDNETDIDELNRLNNQLKQFRGIRQFDAPRRDYNAVTATLSKRFSRKFYVQSSYTYSSTQGNYQGLFSSDTGQVDPNITSLFDLPELMANRDGPLPQDRPHYFKLDGYYSFDFQRAGELTTGVRIRALSGIPINVTGAHYLYGEDETFLMPRGSLGRIDFDYGVSIHLGYKRDLGKGMKLNFFVDFFNLTAFDFIKGQGTAGVDQTYTFFNVNPVVGGKYEDLIYLKELDQGSGAETGAPVRRNRNFGNTNVKYRAPYAQLGARLDF